MGRENKQEERGEKERMKEKERSTAGARSQAATSQTWRQRENTIYKKKER